MSLDALAGEPADWTITPTGKGPEGSLPLTSELLLKAPSGDLFGWTQNAGMGWTPGQMGRPEFLILSTSGGIRNPDGSPVALGYHTGHWEVILQVRAAAEEISRLGGIPFAGFVTDPCDGRTQGTTGMMDSLPYRNDAAMVLRRLARSLGAGSGVALRTGLYLAQAGEFGFVLLTLGSQSGVVPPQLLNPVLASMVLSMLATPFIIMHSNTLVMKLVASEWLQQSLQMTTIARKSINANKHVIICGYGRCGQNLARMLEREGIPYMALDLDPDRVRQAAAAGLRFSDDDGWSDIFSRLLAERIEPRLGDGRATILMEYPTHEAALARPCAHDPRVAERFELWACGVELANAFGELTDPVEQRRRFELEMAAKQRIYGYAYPLDEDFLAALALMPPTSGIALGFDRLVMLATGAPRLADVTWTPLA